MTAMNPTPSVADDRDLDMAVEVLRLLADPTRLALLTLLDGDEQSVSALAARLDRPVPAVSQHLAKLRAGHLVATRRAGSTVFYRQANEHVAALVTHVLRQAEHVRHPAHPPHHSV
jgi:DNA-binding transcriptional ArsR family regulator